MTGTRAKMVTGLVSMPLSYLVTKLHFVTREKVYLSRRTFGPQSFQGEKG